MLCTTKPLQGQYSNPPATPSRIRAVSRSLLCVFWLFAAMTPPWVQAAGGSPISVRQGSAGPAGEAEDNVVWGEMPAGARPVYIGIHGGTVPVSLLTAGDGSPMIAQVGLTGTDFLHFMRQGASANSAARAEDAEDEDDAAPATPDDAGREGEKTPSAAEAGDNRPGEKHPEKARHDALAAGDGATLFLAGRAGDDVPVIYATGKAFERMSLVPDNWAPFGLTEKPLSVEGEVKILTLPKRLPRRGRSAPRR